MLYVKFPMYTRFMFSHPDGIEGKTYDFSSDFEKIGYEWDVSIRNGTGVDIISDPIKIEHPKYGELELVKIKADVATDYHTIIKEFWVPVVCIVDRASRAVEDILKG